MRPVEPCAKLTYSPGAGFNDTCPISMCEFEENEAVVKLPGGDLGSKSGTGVEPRRCNGAEPSAPSAPVPSLCISFCALPRVPSLSMSSATA